MGKLGIQELKDVVNCGICLGELVDALSDGVGLSDIGAALRAAKSVKPAIDAVKSGLIVPELKDLDESEKAELKTFVGEEFDISNDGIEEVIEKAINVVIELSDILKAVQ